MSKNSVLIENLKTMKGFHPDVDVAADMTYKDDYLSNSFFAIGHFEADGHLLNYLYHIMSYVIPGQVPEMTYCFSITDETEKVYYQYSHAYSFSEIEVSTDRFYIKTPAGKMEGDIKKFLLQAEMEHGSIDLSLEPIGYPLYNGGTGKFYMVGMDIFEYSLPTCKTNGKLVLDGKTYEIKDGLSWYDRQWQRKLPKVPDFVMNGMSKIMEKKQGNQEFTLPVWGWMDINLENGDMISTWFAEEEYGENCWATIMHPDGSQRTIDVEPVVCKATNHWKSETSSASYPMTYKIEIPELEADLTVRCSVDDQELYFPEKALYNHYEGASTVEGTYQGKPIKGYCYVELIGDWSK